MKTSTIALLLSIGLAQPVLGQGQRRDTERPACTIYSEQPAELKGLMAHDIRRVASSILYSANKNPSTPPAVKSAASALVEAAYRKPNPNYVQPLQGSLFAEDMHVIAMVREPWAALGQACGSAPATAPSAPTPEEVEAAAKRIQRPGETCKPKQYGSSWVTICE